MNSIITTESLFNSTLISEENYLVELINYAIENQLVTEEMSQNVIKHLFNVTVSLVIEYSKEEEYLTEKEREVMIKNYLYIISLYLSSKKNTEAIELLFGNINILYKDAKAWYNKKLNDAYHKIDKAKKVFETTKYIPAIKYCKRVMRMYGYFQSKLMSIYVEDFSVNSIELDININLTAAEVIYKDMWHEDTTENGFKFFINTAESLTHEAILIEKFDICDIIKFLEVAQKEVVFEEDIEGRSVRIVTNDLIENMTSLIFKQLLISTNYHKSAELSLKFSEEEAKRFVIEVMRGFIEAEDLYEELENNESYMNLPEETRNVFSKLRSSIEYSIKNMRERQRNNLCFIF